MASKRERDLKDKYVKTMLGSFAGLVVGYYLLNYVATWEKVPLGQVFYIIAGCIFIAVSGIFIFFAIKMRYFPKKKKRKGAAPVFLKDIEKNDREKS